jgi:4-hydroxy-tetrahydrodipicolinate reductase
MIQVAIVGGAGRMGQMMAEGLSELSDVEVTTLVDPSEPSALRGATWLSTVAEVNDANVDVVIDFSNAKGVLSSFAWCLKHKKNLVIGATGVAPSELESMGDQALKASIGVLQAANFSLGAVLSERFAVQASPYFDRVEIIELHHDKKVDAPSGTSLATAKGIAQARKTAGLTSMVDPTTTFTKDGARGADGGDGIMIHSVRLPGLVAHQEVLFGRDGEGLTIRHDAYDRRSFVAGVALAVRSVGKTSGLTIGIDALLS